MPYRIVKRVLSWRKADTSLDGSYRFDCAYDKTSKLAVVVHLFYPDLWADIRDRLKNIAQPFDLYISMAESSSLRIDKINKSHKETNIITFPNRGRDVLPFLMILRRIRTLNQYDFILKLHTKKSKHRTDGSSWFKEILDELLPESTQGIFDVLDKVDTGLIGPSKQVVSLSRYMGDNKQEMTRLMTKMYDRQKSMKIIDDQDHNPFFGGTMFWARTDYFDELLKLRLKPSDFPVEAGQVDGTIAHALERIFGRAVHRLSNKRMYSVDSNGRVRELEERAYTEPYKYV